MNKSLRSASDSSSFKPMIRRVKPGLTYNALSPVTWTVVSNASMSTITWIMCRWTGTYRMHPHNRMAVPHRFPTDEFPIPPCILSLSETIVLGLQSFKQAFDGVGKAFVRRDLRHPCRIATAFRNAEESQKSQSGWLALVGYVRVVADAAQFC